jgi:hypothetical protein
VKAYQVPERTRAARGVYIANVPGLELERDERVAALVRLTDFDDDRFLVFATRHGRVKRTVLSEYDSPRTSLIALLILAASWTGLMAATGFNLADAVFAPVDEDDISTILRTPFFVIESGSLMQANQPFGRLKTIDPGDIVVVERIAERADVQTFYGTGERFVANGRGDVIVFLPVPTQSNPNPSPIVHRAMAYVERSIVQVPNPEPGPGRAPTISAPRFTVEEFGIYDARAVTIPELGLHNYQPDRSGFITRGDNPRTNNWADQALGVTVHPVPEDRILGRVALEDIVDPLRVEPEQHRLEQPLVEEGHHDDDLPDVDATGCAPRRRARTPAR